ncbi:MAG: hypothetical protein H7282_09580 [Cytophagaceae bacterium]|nr:hypothetical protein [Cytophagaceae bacterium]
MTSRMFLLFALWMSFHSAICQDYIKAAWGNPFSVQLLNRLSVSYLGSDIEGSYVVFRNQISYGSESIQFCKINAAGEIILKTELRAEFKGKPTEFHAVYNLKGNFYLFTSFWDKSKHTEYIWANKIDTKGNLVTPAIELSQYKADSYDDLAGIDFMISQDSSSVIIGQGMVFKVFDKNLTQRWSQKIVMPYSDATTRELTDFQLSSKNVLHVLFRFSAPRVVTSAGKKEKDRFFYHLSNFNFETGVQREYIPKVDAVSLSETSMDLDDKGNVVIAGFYTQTNKRITDYEAFYSAGFFIKKYDPINQTELINEQYAYTPALLRQLVPDKDLESKEEVIWGFFMDKIKFKADGSIILVARKSYSIFDGVSKELEERNVVGRTSHQFQQLIAASLDSKGKLIWMNSVPILHSTKDVLNFRYYSYLLGITNSYVFFIYNENPRNLTIADPRDFVHMDGPNKCRASSMVKIDQSGTMSKSQIFDTANQKPITYLEPEYCIPLSNTQYILFSSNKTLSKIGYLDFIDR